MMMFRQRMAMLLCLCAMAASPAWALFGFHRQRTPTPPAQWYFQAETGYGGSVHTAGDGWYPAGTAFKLVAVPVAGYRFVGWRGDVPEGARQDNPLLVTLDRTRSLAACFTRRVPVQEDGLVLQYSFDRDDGERVADESGMGRDGALHGAAPAEDRFGQPNRACRFDGYLDYISLNAPALKTFTICGWLKPEGSQESCARFFNSGWAQTFDVAIGGTNNAIRYLARPGTPAWQETQFTAPAGEWSFVALTSDGESVSLYLNGTYGTNFAQAAVLEVTRLGAHLEDPTRDSFRGVMDDIRIYNRPLSDVEIGALCGDAETAPATVTLAVKGDPEPYGFPEPWTYGLHRLTAGTIVTNTAAAFEAVGDLRGVRLACAGWTGAGDVPAEGSGTQAVFRLTTDSEMTWRWNTEYRVTASAQGRGTVEPREAWFAAGGTASVEATAGAGCRFAGWSGDIPAGREMENPLRIDATGSLDVVARFEPEDGVAEGLVAFYPFDGDAADDSGNGNDGALRGAQPCDDRLGRAGGALRLENGAYIEMANPLPDMTSMSFSVWICPSRIDSAPQHVFFEGDMTYSRDLALWIKDDKGWPSAWATKDGSDLAVGRERLQTNAWLHVAGVYDAERGEKTLWVNGERVAGEAVNGPACVGRHFALQVGRCFDGAWAGDSFDGLIDDLRVYNRPLGAAELAALSAGAVPIAVAAAAPAANEPAAPVAESKQLDDIGRAEMAAAYAALAGAAAPTETAVPQSFTVQVNGAPVNCGISAPLDYGGHVLPAGVTVTNSVGHSVDESLGVRYAYLGWTGLGSVPASGSGTSVVFTVTGDSTLTWHWQKQYRLDVACVEGRRAAQPGGGTVDVSGGWFEAGVTPVLTATPESLCRFVRWEGDVPAGNAQENPLTLLMNRPQAVTAVFARDSDGDGMSDDDENVAGTSIVNPDDSLTILNIATSDDGVGMEIRWRTVVGRTYRVMWSRSLVEKFVPAATNIPGTGTVAIFIDRSPAGDESRMYRVEVEN